jgi:hypothetical protein
MSVAATNDHHASNVRSKFRIERFEQFTGVMKQSLKLIFFLLFLSKTKKMPGYHVRRMDIYTLATLRLKRDPAMKVREKERREKREKEKKRF